MADNVTLPGTGEVVSAIEVDSAYVQQIYVLPKPLTPQAAATVSVFSTGTTTVVSANADRTGLILCNRSSVKISLAFGTDTPVVDKGITLDPGASWKMDQWCFTTGAVTAVAEEDSSSLGVQEFE